VDVAIRGILECAQHIINQELGYWPPRRTRTFADAQNLGQSAQISIQMGYGRGGVEMIGVPAARIKKLDLKS